MILYLMIRLSPRSPRAREHTEAGSPRQFVSRTGRVWVRIGQAYGTGATCQEVTNIVPANVTDQRPGYGSEAALRNCGHGSG